MEAEFVNKMTKQLEEKEAMMLAKLQNTYNKKEVNKNDAYEFIMVS